MDPPRRASRFAVLKIVSSSRIFGLTAILQQPRCLFMHSSASSQRWPIMACVSTRFWKSWSDLSSSLRFYCSFLIHPYFDSMHTSLLPTFFLPFCLLLPRLQHCMVSSQPIHLSTSCQRLDLLIYFSAYS